jgi:hypothetical protein
MSDVSVALDALRSDANVWDHAADSLAPPKAAIGELGLSANDVMSYAAARGLDRQYNYTRSVMQDMIDQAGNNFRKLSTALRDAAQLYEQNEEQHKHTITRAGGH